MGLRLYPIYFTSSLGRLRQKRIMVKLIPTFFVFFLNLANFGCYKRVPPSTSNRSWKLFIFYIFYYATFTKNLGKLVLAPDQKQCKKVGFG